MWKWGTMSRLGVWQVTGLGGSLWSLLLLAGSPEQCLREPWAPAAELFCCEPIPGGGEPLPGGGARRVLAGREQVK